MTRWIHAWADDGHLSDDDAFAEGLADQDLVSDDDEAWDAYLTAQINLAAARLRVVDSLRTPTDAERDANRARIREHLSRCEELDRAATSASEPCEAMTIEWPH
jgi:hypothetical protein